MKVGCALIIALALVVTPIAGGVANAEEPPPGPFAPVFTAIRSALDPLAPAAAQVAEGLASLNQELIEAARTTGGGLSATDPAVVQVAAAMKQLQDQLKVAADQLGPAMAMLKPLATQAGEQGAAAAYQLDGAIRGQRSSFESVYQALGPGVGPLCQLKGQAPLVVSLTPYGFVFEGVLEPMEPACASVEPAPAIPISSLDPAFEQYGDLLAGTSYALAPAAGPLQPAFQPLCTSVALVNLGAVLVALPVSPTPISGPAANAACGIGRGSNPAGPAALFLSLAAQQLSPVTDEIAASIEIASPVIAPLTSLLKPVTSSLCQLLPFASQGAALLPVASPVRPEPFVSASTKVLCEVLSLPDSRPATQQGDRAPEVLGIGPVANGPSVFGGGPGIRMGPKLPTSGPVTPTYSLPAAAVPAGRLPGVVWTLVPIGLIALALVSWLVLEGEASSAGEAMSRLLHGQPILGLRSLRQIEINRRWAAALKEARAAVRGKE